MRRTLALVLCLAVAACGAPAATPDDQAEFDRWRGTHSIADFERYLAEAGLNGVLPTRDLLRTATDWERCGGPRFEVPPREHWPHVKQVLGLVAELKKRGILKDVQGASAYRNPALNACAGGAARSSHTRSFALDLTGAPGQIDMAALCEFWRTQGKAWAMGLSRYPSGRIHLDTSGWRTWGADHTGRSAVCAR